MDNRKTITTAARLALWEAHGRKCAYTGEPVAWSELEIDYIIPVKSDAARKTELHGAGIIGADFDINGFENLLPTKAHRNNQKSISSQMKDPLGSFSASLPKRRKRQNGC